MNDDTDRERALSEAYRLMGHRAAPPALCAQIADAILAARAEGIAEGERRVREALTKHVEVYPDGDEDTGPNGTFRVSLVLDCASNTAEWWALTGEGEPPQPDTNRPHPLCPDEGGRCILGHEGPDHWCPVVYAESPQPEGGEEHND